jgi:hypothetical protein
MIGKEPFAKQLQRIEGWETAGLPDGERPTALESEVSSVMFEPRMFRL